MANPDIQAGWNFHNSTKHSHRSVRTNPHSLDWANQPLPFKIYPEIERIELPRDVPQTGVAALAAISANFSAANRDAIPDLRDLARIPGVRYGLLDGQHLDLHAVCRRLPAMYLELTILLTNFGALSLANLSRGPTRSRNPPGRTRRSNGTRRIVWRHSPLLLTPHPRNLRICVKSGPGGRGSDAVEI